MTLILDLTPDQERRLQAEAQRSGLPLPDYAKHRLLWEDEHSGGTNTVDRILQSAGLLVTPPVRYSPEELASYHEVESIPYTGRPVSETLVEERR